MLKKTDLTSEQNAAITRLFEHDETLLIADMGFGKAIVGMTALSELMDAGHGSHAVVFAPLQVCELTWGPERGKWEHITCPVHVCSGGDARKREAVANEWLRSGGIIVVNFDNVVWFTQRYSADFVLFDEITKLKAVGGTSAKKLRYWVRDVPWRAGMSGTVVAEAGEDLYGQALLLDLGKALGTRKDKFLRTYFEPRDFNEYSWELRPGAGEQIAERLSDLVYVPDQSSYQDSLPPCQDVILHFSLDATTAPIYHAMETDSVWGDVVAENAAVRKGKLAQIAAGGLYDNDGELTWFHKKRAEWVVNFLHETLHHKGPTVVVYQYRFEIDYYADKFPKCLILGAGNKVGPNAIDAWNRGEVPILFMHPKSAAHGLNLQYGSNTLVHLTPLWGADPWRQCLARLRRRGQPKPDVRRIVLATEDTVDMEMLERLGYKYDTETEMMDELIANGGGSA